MFIINRREGIFLNFFDEKETNITLIGNVKKFKIL